MALRYWVGGAGNWSDPNHWSLTSGGASGVSVPTISDDVFTDANSGSGTLLLDITAKCKTLSSSGSISVDKNNFELEILNDITFNGTGNIDLSGNLIISGDGSLSISNTVGTLTVTNCDLDMRGNGNLDVDKTGWVWFKSFKVGYTGKTVVHQGSNSAIGSLEGLLGQGGGTLTLNTRWYIFGEVGIIPFDQNNMTINGSQKITLYCNGVLDGQIDMPALSMTGSGSLHYFAIELYTSNTITVNHTGNMVTDYGYYVHTQAHNVDATIKYNNHNFVGTALFSVFNTGTDHTSTIHLDYGSANITVGTFDGTAYDGATSTITEDFSDSNFIIKSSFCKMGVYHNIDVGTGSIEFTGNCTLTLNNNIAPHLILNGNILTFADTGRVQRIQHKNLSAFTRALFTVGITITVLTYENNDLDGRSGVLAEYWSTSSGSTATINLPNNISIDYFNPKDLISLSDVKTYTSNNCVDGGNTKNFFFISGINSDLIIQSKTFKMPTSTGNFTMDFELGGHIPKGAVIKVVRTASDGTPQGGNCISYGATDLSRQWVSCIEARDNFSTTWTHRSIYTDSCIFGISPTSTVEYKANYGSSSANKLIVNFTTAPSSEYYIQVTAYAGNSMQFWASTFSPNPVQNNYSWVSGWNFKPDLILTCGSSCSSGTIFTNNTFSHGVAINDKNVTQRCFAMRDKNNVGTTEINGVISDQYVIRFLDQSTGLDKYAIEVSNITDNGTFRAYSRLAGGNTTDAIGYVVIGTKNKASVWCDSIESPVVTGKKSYDTKFKPIIAEMTMTKATAFNTITSNGDIGGITAISTFTENKEDCLSVIDEDNVSTMNAQSIYTSKAVSVYDDGGVDTFQADYSSMDTRGFTLDFTKTDATARDWFAWAIGFKRSKPNFIEFFR